VVNVFSGAFRTRHQATEIFVLNIPFEGSGRHSFDAEAVLDVHHHFSVPPPSCKSNCCRLGSAPKQLAGELALGIVFVTPGSSSMPATIHRRALLGPDRRKGQDQEKKSDIAPDMADNMGLQQMPSCRSLAHSPVQVSEALLRV
jgi:hypothetical protein